MSSYQESVVPQEKHRDLPFSIDMPVPYRRITTLRKLPMIRPKIKRMARGIYAMLLRLRDFVVCAAARAARGAVAGIRAHIVERCPETIRSCGELGVFV